jgi:hypothetical protein
MSLSTRIVSIIRTSEDKINLSSHGIIDEQIPEIVRLISEKKSPVKYFDLYRNNIGDEGAKELAKLNNVRYLNLGYNNLTNEGLSLLLLNANIEALDASLNGITDEIVDFATKNAKQSYLNVNENKITAESLTKIDAHIKLNKFTKEKTISDKLTKFGITTNTSGDPATTRTDQSVSLVSEIKLIPPT